MVQNDLLMQFQADILDVPVIRPKVAETTSLGAAYAAGLAVGFWGEIEDLRANWGKDHEWTPQDGRRPARPPVPHVEEGGDADVRLGRGRGARACLNETRATERDGDFAEGEEQRPPPEHEGDFAEGQEAEHPDHPHDGSFAEGQEEEPDDADEHEGDFAEGQEEDK